MAFWQARDFLFCRVCGTLLSFDSLRFASCAASSARPKDIRRELKIEPFVILESAPKEEDTVSQRAMVNETCPKCRNPQLEYYTKQLRSADEGQTVFYECPECRHKFSVNT
ncbi:hypothetical protein GUJ93_ZPchr0003g18606 [Zizania palustris]|uniref:DNA-directed RNA polymerase subunit n=1 Tax=Zizania palustris TaxID=103762 RepID=A0A8J5RXU1_ZIZPA|nr:hypothetical protein GUJ93_ZPchr0003g18606 [Zizania palustris]